MLRSRVVTPLVELLSLGITPEKLAISSALGFMLGSRPCPTLLSPAIPRHADCVVLGILFRYRLLVGVSGIFPIPGTTSAMCVVVTWLLALNPVAIQIVNLSTTPLQLLLIPRHDRQVNQSCACAGTAFSASETSFRAARFAGLGAQILQHAAPHDSIAAFIQAAPHSSTL